MTTAMEAHRIGETELGERKFSCSKGTARGVLYVQELITFCTCCSPALSVSLCFNVLRRGRSNRSIHLTWFFGSQIRLQSPNHPPAAHGETPRLQAPLLAAHASVVDQAPLSIVVAARGGHRVRQSPLPPPLTAFRRLGVVHFSPRIASAASAVRHPLAAFHTPVVVRRFLPSPPPAPPSPSRDVGPL